MSNNPTNPTVPAGYDAPPLAEPTTAELDTLRQQFSLLGAGGEPVRLSQIKTFYKKRNWHYILARVNVLVENGTLTETTVQGANGGSWNEYRVNS